MSRIEPILSHLEKIRGYTTNLIAHLPGEDWFRRPAEGVTHVAWQVGHIAVAQYGLCLKRIRGARPEDERILPASFLALFGKGSIPEADAAKYPAPPAIRQALDAVHRRTLEELPALAESVLDEPADPPHAMFRTKGGGLEFAAYHEMLHAGQIALLRRLFGHPPLR